MATVGIDFGTTYSSVAIFRSGRIEVIPNACGGRTTASAATFLVSPSGSSSEEQKDKQSTTVDEKSTPPSTQKTHVSRLLGDAAWNQIAAYPKSTIYQAKRLLGRRYGDMNVQIDKKQNWSFDVGASSNQQSATAAASAQDDSAFFSESLVSARPVINITTSSSTSSDAGDGDDETQYDPTRTLFQPEEAAAMVLSKLKQLAEAHLGEEVKNAVISVPSYFTDAQRQATKDAGAIAGLRVLRLVNESTAAALAFGFSRTTTGGNHNSQNNNNKAEQNVLVIDIGGGTMDVTLLIVDDGIFEVKAVVGDTHLGGEDVDTRLVNYFLEELRKKLGTTTTANDNTKNLLLARLYQDQSALRRLRRACERLKKDLSTSESASMLVEGLLAPWKNNHDGEDGEDDDDDDDEQQQDESENIKRPKCTITEDGSLQATMSRGFFELLCGDLFKALPLLMDRVFADARISKSELDHVVFCGGSTRVPMVRRIVAEYFFPPSSSSQQNQKQNLQQSAALFIPSIPDRDDPINLDEAVAGGCAMQAFILSGGSSRLLEDMLLLDVTALGVGVATADGEVASLVPRNTTIPCRKEQRFTTYADKQEAITVRLYEGEGNTSRNHNNNTTSSTTATTAEQCRLLGTYDLTGIPPAPRGIPQIQVTVAIDANGIVGLNAMDMSTGKSAPVLSMQQVRGSSSRLSVDVLQKLVRKNDDMTRMDSNFVEGGGGGQDNNNVMLAGVDD